MSNGAGSIEDRLEAEGSGPNNVAQWGEQGPDHVYDVAAVGESRRLISMHAGHGRLSMTPEGLTKEGE